MSRTTPKIVLLHPIEYQSEDLEHIVAVLLIDLAHIGDLNHAVLAILTLTDIERIATLDHFINERLCVNSLRQINRGYRVGGLFIGDQGAAAQRTHALTDNFCTALITLNAPGKCFFLNVSYTTFVRNENYWGEQPYYDKIVAKYIPDNASRVQALKTGEIDLIYGSAELSYEDYNQATAIDGIEGKFAPSGSTVRNIILNFNGNLSDLSVRQALAYAIDKEAISEGLTYGYEPVANTIVPDGTPYSDICGTEDYSYNVDRANQLLDEAGWIINQSTGIREKNGTPLHVVFTCPTDDSTIGSIATLFQSQLAEVGIEVEIKSMEKMEWYASYMNPAGWDITAMTAGFFNYAMPQCWFSAMMAQMPEDVSIPLLDNSDEFISALSEFKTCNDDARLKELFELLINTDLDQVLDVPLTHQMDMIVYNTDKIADYNFASDYAFLDVTQITPAE